MRTNNAKEDTVKKISAIGLVILLSVILGCGSGVQRKEIDGVVHVINKDVTAEMDITVSLERTIGKEMGDENYMFSTIGGVTIDDEGRLYVLDSLNHRIMVYSREGEYLRTIGRKGSGPGEFSMPGSVLITGKGELAVSDVIARKMIFFDSQGKHLRDLAPRSFFPTPPINGFWTTDSMIVGFLTQFEQDENGMRMGYALQKVDPDSGGIRTTYYKQLSRFDPQDFDPMKNLFFFTVDGSNSVYISIFTTEKYEISRYTPDGEIDLVIEREFVPVPKTGAEIEEEKEIVTQRMEMGGAPKDFLKWEPKPNRFAMGSMNTDDSERLWVRVGTEPQDAPPKFDVFSPEGELLGKVVLEGIPDDVTFRICGNTMLGFDSNPDDFPKVYVMTISG